MCLANLSVGKLSERMNRRQRRSLLRVALSEEFVFDFQFSLSLGRGEFFLYRVAAMVLI